MNRINRTLWLALLAIAAALPTHSRATDYPSRPVKLVVSYPPGGSNDALARIFAQWLTDKLGQPFIVENKPGAGNNLGVATVVNAPADGYTMLLTNPANASNATLYKNLKFDFLRDIVPVAGLARSPQVMVVTNTLPVQNVQEFIDYCKAHPGQINMGSAGIGGSLHLAGELFKSMTGCEMVHIPYKGSNLALMDLIAGHVQVMFDNLPSAIGQIRAGKVHALAVTSEQTDLTLPQLPTVAETIPGFQVTAWFGIGMPRGTPRAIVERVNAEVNRALADPTIRTRLAELGSTPMPGTPEDLGSLVAVETARWGKVVAAIGATAE